MEPVAGILLEKNGDQKGKAYEGDEECETSYADKKGKYQKQTGITHPKISQA